MFATVAPATFDMQRIVCQSARMKQKLDPRLSAYLKRIGASGGRKKWRGIGIKARKLAMRELGIASGKARRDARDRRAT